MESEVELLYDRSLYNYLPTDGEVDDFNLARRYHKKTKPMINIATAAGAGLGMLGGKGYLKWREKKNKPVTKKHKILVYGTGAVAGGLGARALVTRKFSNKLDKRLDRRKANRLEGKYNRADFLGSIGKDPRRSKPEVTTIHI